MNMVENLSKLGFGKTYEIRHKCLNDKRKTINKLDLIQLKAFHF